MPPRPALRFRQTSPQWMATLHLRQWMGSQVTAESTAHGTRRCNAASQSRQRRLSMRLKANTTKPMKADSATGKRIFAPQEIAKSRRPVRLLHIGDL
jgi:hypothetical protein